MSEDTPGGIAVCVDATEPGAKVARLHCTLTPPADHNGEALEAVYVTTEYGRSQVMRLDGTRLWGMSRLDSIIMPEEVLWQWGRYREPMASRIRRRFGFTGDIATIRSVSRALDDLPLPLRELWDDLDETQRLIALWMADHATRKAGEAEARHKREVARAYTEGQYDARLKVEITDESVRRGLEAFVRALIPLPEGEEGDEDDGDEYYD